MYVRSFILRRDQVSILPNLFHNKEGDTMNKHIKDQDGIEVAANKKINLVEVARRMLQQKKNAQRKAKETPKHYTIGQPMMKSQHIKRINNQRKRMGV